MRHCGAATLAHGDLLRGAGPRGAAARRRIPSLGAMLETPINARKPWCLRREMCLTVLRCSGPGRYVRYP